MGIFFLLIDESLMNLPKDSKPTARVEKTDQLKIIKQRQG